MIWALVRLPFIQGDNFFTDNFFVTMKHYPSPTAPNIAHLSHTQIHRSLGRTLLGMKSRFFCLFVFTALTGCATSGSFRHQIEPGKPHSVIEIAPPLLRRGSLGDVNFSSKTRYLEVKAIDGIPVRSRLGKTQVYRVPPGEHQITYETIRDVPINNSVEKSITLASGGVARSIALFVPFRDSPMLPILRKDDYQFRKKIVEFDSQIVTVPGKRYYIKGTEVTETEIVDSTTQQSTKG